MAILIKTMDMPASCGDCRLIGYDEGYDNGNETSDCYYCPFTYKWMSFNTVSKSRHKNCPLEEVEIADEECGTCKHYGEVTCQIQKSLYGLKDYDYCSHWEEDDE